MIPFSDIDPREHKERNALLPDYNPGSRIPDRASDGTSALTRFSIQSRGFYFLNLLTLGIRVSIFPNRA